MKNLSKKIFLIYSIILDNARVKNVLADNVNVNFRDLIPIKKIIIIILIIIIIIIIIGCLNNISQHIQNNLNQKWGLPQT
jgi:amino acid permease